MTKFTALLVFVFLNAAAAQESVQPEPGTRAAEIRAEQVRKQTELQPENVSKTEEFLRDLKDQRWLERITGGVYGIRPKFGGLATGSGFALGPEYFRPDFAKGKVAVRSSAMISFGGYQLYDVQLSFPRIAEGRLFADLLGRHTNFPSLQYYGPGQDSAKNGRSSFRREATEFTGTLGVRPIGPFRIGFVGGYSLYNIGPGTDDRFASTDATFTEATTPGLNAQTNFLQAGGYFQVDTRDYPGEPRNGFNYIADFRYFSDRDVGRYSFRRITLEAQQYIPFFNDRRVIALRGQTIFTNTDSGQRVPFYLQPVVGGSETLRGYRPFRYYDNNSLVMNAEYRWEVYTGLDMALFFDAAKVFPRLEDFEWRGLKTSAGFGLRFNVRNNLFMRIDNGFSKEGYQVWLKFNNVF